MRACHDEGALVGNSLFHQKLRALDGRDGLRVGRPWSPHRANRGNSDPFCADGGNVARGARIGYTGRARPPPLGWALPTVSSGWWRERA